MLEQLTTFFEQPTQDAYLELRDLVIREDDFQWSSPVFDHLSHLASRAQFDDLIRVIDGLSSAWAICPRIHYLVAIGAEAMGDDEEVEIRHLAFHACIQGLLASGGGTEQDPYRPTYLCDELDVLTACRLMRKSQELICADDRRFDVVTTTCGQTVWFDITEPMRASKIARDRQRLGSHKRDVVQKDHTPSSVAAAIPIR